MNTHTNFFKSNKTRLNINKAIDKDFNPGLPRVKTSSPATRAKDATNNRIFPSIFSSYNIQNLNVIDQEKLRDELIKYKNELHKRNKEFQALKISFSKLESDNKKNSKIIEDVLDKAYQKKNPDDMKDQGSEESDIKNGFGMFYISNSNLNKLMESHIISNMKNQLNDYKVILSSKEEEISFLKKTTKVSKYHELEIKMNNTVDELNNLTDKFNILKMSYLEKDSILKEITDERDYYRTMMIRIKSQYEDGKEKLQYYQDKFNKLSELNSILEEKLSTTKFQLNSVKTQLKEKESSSNKIEHESTNLEHIVLEKEKMGKSIKFLNKNLTNVKDDLEKKNKKIKEVEENNKVKKLNSKRTNVIESIDKEKELKLTKLDKNSLEPNDNAEKFTNSVDSKNRENVEQPKREGMLNKNFESANSIFKMKDSDVVIDSLQENSGKLNESSIDKNAFIENMENNYSQFENKENSLDQEKEKIDNDNIYENEINQMDENHNLDQANN